MLGVHGGYTFYALTQQIISSATIIDTHIADATRERANKVGGVALTSGDFGDAALVKSLARADAVIFYDVLLHQVKPDWDEITEMYASRTNHFIIYIQMFTGAEKTVRLIDLGPAEHLANTPYEGDEQFIREMFDKRDQKRPEHEIIYGDTNHTGSGASLTQT